MIYAIKRIYSSINVVTAAKSRIKNVFKNNLPVYLSFSGGKDSIVIAHLILSLIQSNEVDPKQSTVQFIDEEAIYPCIEKSVMEWRKKFLMVGSKFEWFALEVKHFNCFNLLENDESFICFDRYKKDVWVRRPPSFAIISHKYLKARKDKYQDFLPRITKNGITITGVRAAESIQRLMSIANSQKAGNQISTLNHIFPIYDWKDNDVWLYLKDNNIKIPDVYLYLWQVGTKKTQLRVSQFFSIDTAKSLVEMNQFYPNLMDKIIKREPNAYLAMLYWDSEMFGRSTRKRKQIEKNLEQKNYKEELIKMFNNMDKYFTSESKKHIANKYKKLFFRVSIFADEKDFKAMYESLVKGDPKLRSYRAVFNNIFGKYVDNTKKEVKRGVIYD